MQGLDGRLNDIRETYSEFRSFYEIGGGLVLVMLGVFIGATLFNNSNDYQTNLYTEFLSISVTVLVLDSRAQRREARRRRDELRDRLLREAASSVNETARSAIEELERREHLTGKNGWLVKADLERANLHGVNLKFANLYQANLSRANLQDCELFDANLKEAYLNGANLQRALLSYADLSDSDLSRADLRATKLQETDLTRANLNFADLRGADLTNADLNGTMMVEAHFDEQTILPDGTRWTPESDLSRFGILTDLQGLKPNYLQTDSENDDTMGKTPEI